ncbi:glycosyltransferase family 39 protein [Actinosynnema sp. NPDC020468]|uniref:ArnT family glycosyltransferase n=1 Tax=Actinosynnema sp. NPDC020468 TaxID=3154488 RepID=UPI0033F1FCD9
MSTQVEITEERHPVLPRLSRAVPALVVAFGVLVCVTQNGYELAGDEYFFLVAGDHLAWGYADQPPLVAALARLSDTLLPGSRLLLRLPMVLAVCAGILVTALIAREFGGRRAVQLWAAAAFALSTYALVHTRAVTTDAIDMACWATVTWLLVRWTRTRRDGLWWGIGLATAFALQGKYIIGVFWVLVALALLAVGPREVFRKPVVWLAGLLAALSTIPSLTWQARNGWPQADEGPAIRADAEALGGHLVFLPSLFSWVGLAGAVLFGWGTWWLLRHGRDTRFLGVVLVAAVALVWLLELRRNYLGGLFPLGIAVGAVRFGLLAERRPWLWRGAALPALALTVVVLLPALIPVGPGWLGGVNRYLLPDHRFDWDGLAVAVSEVARRVPESERGTTVVIAGDYWRSSALERGRDEHSLPPVYGDMQGSYFFGPPPPGTTTVIYVDDLPEPLRRHCGSHELGGTFVDPLTSPVHREQTHTPIHLCRDLRVPIDRLWPELRHTTLPWDGRR